MQITDQQISQNRNWNLFRFLWALFAIFLIGATWRLWFAVEANLLNDQALDSITRFPKVPLLEIGKSIPQVVDNICTLVVLASLLLFAILSAIASFSKRLPDCTDYESDCSRSNSKWRIISAISLLAFFAGGLVLIVSDQHRVQPWFYQFLLVSIVFAWVERDRSIVLLRVLTISIYLYSALGKFDYEFVSTVGRDFLKQALEFVAVDSERFPMGVQMILAHGFPLFELLVGLLFCWPRSRKLAIALAVLLHGGILLIVGPLGLQHQWGVLLWNVYFIVQAVFLFGILRLNADSKTFPEKARQAKPRSPLALVAQKLVTAIIVLAIALPATERFGGYDHWPSWSLYAPHNSRVIVEVHPTAFERIPKHLQSFLVQQKTKQERAGKDGNAVEEATENDWLRFRMDQWSIQSRNVPLYPQDRFQVGVAIEFLRQSKLDRDFRIHILSMASRIDGHREIQTITTLEKLLRRSAEFRLNAQPK